MAVAGLLYYGMWWRLVQQMGTSVCEEGATLHPDDWGVTLLKNVSIYENTRRHIANNSQLPRTQLLTIQVLFFSRQYCFILSNYRTNTGQFTISITAINISVMICCHLFFFGLRYFSRIWKNFNERPAFVSLPVITGLRNSETSIL